MERNMYEEVKQQMPTIEKYTEEIKLVEEFFIIKSLNIDNLTIVFWNHLLTLFERVDSNEQNVMEIEESGEMSGDAKKLSDEFCTYIASKRNFNITDFEKYLLTIYFQQMIIKKENKK